MRFNGSEYCGTAFDDFFEMKCLADVHDLLHSVAQSKICINAGKRADICDLICTTKHKIYCDSCRGAHIRKFNRERYAEKNAKIAEEKTKQKKERTRQLKKKVARRESGLLLMRKKPRVCSCSWKMLV